MTQHVSSRDVQDGLTIALAALERCYPSAQVWNKLVVKPRYPVRPVSDGWRKRAQCSEPIAKREGIEGHGKSTSHCRPPGESPEPASGFPCAGRSLGRTTAALNTMNFLGRLFHTPHPGEPEDPALDEALERAAMHVEPRVKQTRHWPDRYRASIGRALVQARRVAQGVPGPVTLDREHWVGDPLVHALFASADDMRRLLSMNTDLRDFIAVHGGSELHVLLSMRREDKNIMGMEASGGILRRDVPQHVVWFTDHHFLAPAASEAEARENLLWTLFDRFLERLSVGVDQLKHERERLVQEKDQAQARLRAATEARRPVLERDLQDRLTRLGEIAQLLDPGHLHDVFDTVLSRPEECLYLERHAFHLDAMGVDQGEGNGPTIEFTDLVERYQAPRTVVIARCPGVTPNTLADRLDEAGHWL